VSEHICLIVDDEPAIRMYLRTILEREHVQCLEAESAVHALRVIQRLQGKLDLVVTDIKMPGDMSGIDLAYSIGSSFPNIAVILITGYVDEAVVKQAASAFKLIQKPFAVNAVLEAVKQTLAR
jgi:two-component system cell cycle sensor histidine kinase/response regulator CckA